VKPAFSRGFKNDGHIDVDLSPSDDEDNGFFNQREYGKVYKLPEEGIKLDFISRYVCYLHLPASSTNEILEFRWDHCLYQLHPQRLLTSPKSLTTLPQIAIPF
jgi:hypothetical protein